MKKVSFLLVICIVFAVFNFSLFRFLSYAENEVALDVLNEEYHDEYLEETLSDDISYSSGTIVYANFT